MTKTNFFFLVEGQDDSRFIDQIIIPLINKENHECIIYTYCNETPEKIQKFIRSIRAMQALYLLIADIDQSPCVTSKKDLLVKKFGSDEDNMIIVIKEIESWYFCGIRYDNCQKIGIRKSDYKKYSESQPISKEQFNLIIPKKMTRTEFLISILKHFDKNYAKEKNSAFKYFLERCKKYE